MTKENKNIQNSNALKGGGTQRVRAYNACRYNHIGQALPDNRESLVESCAVVPVLQPYGAGSEQYLLRTSDLLNCQVKPDIHTRYCKGFTLIELLVVVLIIAILAAIAVPQYQYAVEKAKFAQFRAYTDTLYKAEEYYKLVHGNYTYDLSLLDIQLPMANCTPFEVKNVQAGYTCNGVYYGIFDYQTNVQAMRWPNISYLRFLQDSTSPYTAKKGDIGCWARGNTARRLCESLGTWDRKYTNRNGWEYQYIFSRAK